MTGAYILLGICCIFILAGMWWLLLYLFLGDYHEFHKRQETEKFKKELRKTHGLEELNDE